MEMRERMVRRDLGLDRRVFLKAVGLAGIAAAEPAFAQLFVNIQGVGAKHLRILPRLSATI